MRIANIEMLDNGLMVQEVVKEGEPREGINVFLDADAAKAHIGKIIDAKCLEKGVCGAVADEPKKVVSFPAPPQQGAPSLVTGDTDPDAYEAELLRIVTENDRDAVHARLKEHVAAGRISAEYGVRNGVKKLVDTLREADLSEKTTSNAPSTSPSQEDMPQLDPSVAGWLNGIPMAPGVPPPTEGTENFVPNPAYVPAAPQAPAPAAAPLQPGVPSEAQVSEALQGLASLDPVKGPAAAYALVQQCGVSAVSEIAPEHRAWVMQEAAKGLV